MAVLDTATLAEAALVLRKYSALCVNDTMFYVRTFHSHRILPGSALHPHVQGVILQLALVRSCHISVTPSTCDALCSSHCFCAHPLMLRFADR